MAAPAEPPIIARKDPQSGLLLKYQTFDGGEIAVSLDKLSVASWYSIFGAKGYAVPDTFAVSCHIPRDGRIWSFNCFGADAMQRYSPEMAAARRLEVFAEAPVFPPLARGNESVIREVRYLLRFAKPAPPPIDLEKGPLVPIAQIQGLRRRLGEMDYPPRALREERQGVQTVECQVQVDHSLICRGVAFDPPENGPVFAEAAHRMFMPFPVKPQLTDGTPSVHARFQTRVRWAIPKDEPEKQP